MLVDYFTEGIASSTLDSIGAEIETMFVDIDGNPIQVATSQKLLGLLAKQGWRVVSRKGKLITTLEDRFGNKIFYELGRHNLELSTIATNLKEILRIVRTCLGQMYTAGEKVQAFPYFAPVLTGTEDLLVIPDERDATWLELDGRAALAPLARTASVQFTFAVDPVQAIRILNKFGQNISAFLADYPQDAIWRKYIRTSSAEYQPTRYGGPLVFSCLQEYCDQLMSHDVVQGTKLVPFAEVADLDIPLFLRSIWWHFRLKRYCALP